MAGSNINRVIITGNLTRDPELRALPSGNNVCDLRVAVNERIKNAATGNYEDRANFFNVTVWGKQGESAHRYLSKGSGVAIDGRLRFREWETDGQKRSTVDIVAQQVQFLGGGNSQPNTTASDIPVDSDDFIPADAAGDDIPF